MSNDFGTKNKEYLEKCLKNLKPGDEFEIRLGSFVYNHELKKSVFNSRVEPDAFYRLKKYFNGSPIFKKETLCTREHSYKTGNDTVKRIETFEDESFERCIGEYFLLKHSKNVYDVYDFNFRYSTSVEKIVDSTATTTVTATATEPYTRQKIRNTYLFEFGKIDITIVQMPDETIHEVEYEINNSGKVPLDILFNETIAILTLILQLRQDNYYIITPKEKYQVFLGYKKLTGVNYFIGAQPETMQKSTMSLLYRNMYSVTDKADGERFFLFINDLGVVYLIDSNVNNILRTEMHSSTFKNCILDGELIRDGNNIAFYAFDLVFVNDFDIRGNQEYLLKKRIDTVIEIVNSISKSPGYLINVKKYIYHNVFMGSDIILDDIQNKPYMNDGLIYTPVSEPYPKTKKWTSLMKWKPSELNTIDFYSVKVAPGKWELYVQTNEASVPGPVPQSNGKMLFDINAICESKSKREFTTHTTTFDDNIIDPSTNETFKSGTVIEFAWDPIQSKFVPHRTRWDKTFNHKKHGNFYTVACSIWNNIHNPVTREQIVQLKNVPLKNLEKRFFFDAIVNYKTLLLHTWATDNFARIYNPEYTRYYRDQNYTQCDISKCNDLVNIFVDDLNLFNGSAEKMSGLLDTIETATMINGTVVLNFIENGLAPNVPNVMYHDNYIMYAIKELSEKSCNLFVNGLIHETIYYVSSKILDEEMAYRGFTLEHSDNWHGEGEQDFVQNVMGLYKTRVYRKTSSILNRIEIMEKSETTLPTDTETMITIDNIKLVKITSNHDIYNIMNCIEYKYYLCDHPIMPIYNFDDIKCIDVGYDKIFPGDELYGIGTDTGVMFYTHTFTLQVKDIVTHVVNYYMVLYNGNIICSNPDDAIKSLDKLCHIKKYSELDTLSQQDTRAGTGAGAEASLPIIDSMQKMTIKDLKEKIKELNTKLGLKLKTSGSKQELIDRISLYS